MRALAGTSWAARSGAGAEEPPPKARARPTASTSATTTEATNLLTRYLRSVAVIRVLPLACGVPAAPCSRSPAALPRGHSARAGDSPGNRRSRASVDRDRTPGWQARRALLELRHVV